MDIHLVPLLVLLFIFLIFLISRSVTKGILLTGVVANYISCVWLIENLHQKRKDERDSCDNNLNNKNINSNIDHFSIRPQYRTHQAHQIEPMANRHFQEGYIHNYTCQKDKRVCSFDNRTCRNQCYNQRNPDEYVQENPANSPPLYDNMDVINDIYGYKAPTADERLAAKMTQSGKKNQRAIEGAVRATRDQFECHLIDELDEHEKRRWWDQAEYPVDESNWLDQLDYYNDNYNGY